MALIHHIEHPAVEGIRVGKTGPRGGYKINSSCIVYRLGSTIIDTGPTSQWKIVKRFLDERGVREALLTHYHEDHSGNCGHVQDCFNAVIHAHHSSHQRLSKGFDINLASRLLFGGISLSNPTEFPENVETSSGHVLETHHIPGHSDDSSGLLEASEGWFFSGDLYVSSKTRYGHSEENVKEHIQSLEHVLTLDFDTLFCAHQGLISDGKIALAKKRDYLKNLVEEVEHLHNQGIESKAIARQLFGREDAVAYTSGQKMNKEKLILAALKPLPSKK